MKAQSQSSSIPTKHSNRVGVREGAAWTRAAVLQELKAVADPRVRAKMSYFGVNVPKAYGVSTPVLQALAKHIGKNHQLAQELWESGIHEARILATFIGEPEKVTAAEMERWASDFDSWDVVDATCCYLYAQAKPAWSKVAAWSRRKEEFVKRASFSLVAYLSYKDKAAPDARFIQFLRVIEREAHDERNFVRKAVNWALRNIGKRNIRLNREAIRAAEKIRRQDSRAARWIAADALRELKSSAVQARLKRKQPEKMTPIAPDKLLKIRYAKSGDAPRIAVLAGQLGYPSTTAQMRERLRGIKPASQHAIFVAEFGKDGVIGWVHVSRQPLLEVEIRAEINGLVVAEDQRSFGAGARLLAAAENWARKHGCKGMSVRSNVIRDRAHKFYERHGYEHYKTQKSFRKPL